VKTVPERGAKLFHGDKEVGYITSAVFSPRQKSIVALGYVNRGANAGGTQLTVRTASADYMATVG
jgi:glycine cleavage system aminomethyltransferase T